MPYFLEKFGSTLLPTAAGQVDLSVAPARILTRDLPGGGAYDYYGNEDAPLGGQRIKVKGSIYDATPAGLKTKFQALRARQGQRDLLYRLWDDGTTRETIDARLVSVKASRQVEDGIVIPVEMEFQTVAPYWLGGAVSASVATVNITSSGVVARNETYVNNGDAPVTDIVFTVTVNSGELTRVNSVFSIGPPPVQNFGFDWQGSVTAGEVLVIDTGKQSVTLDGVDNYSNFSLATITVFPPATRLADWARIAPSGRSTSATILFWTTTAVNVDMTASYNHTWK